MCYSYGVLLLEMFTGKRPTDSMFRLSTALLRRLFLNMWKPLVIQHSFIKEKLGCQAQSIQTPLKPIALLAVTKFESSWFPYFKLESFAHMNYRQNGWMSRTLLLSCMPSETLCLELEFLEAKYLELLVDLRRYEPALAQ